MARRRNATAGVFFPLTARDFSLRVTYPFCGVGLHADTVDSRTCPPEGGRYMTPDTDVRVSTSYTIYSTYVFSAGRKYSPHVFLGGLPAGHAPHQGSCPA